MQHTHRLLKTLHVEHMFVLTTMSRFLVHYNVRQELIIMAKYGAAQVIIKLIIILERHFIP